MLFNKLRPHFRFVALMLCSYATDVLSEAITAKPMTLESSAFIHQNAIPKEFTCDGPNVSPPLMWSDVPQNAKSLALIVDDPDAPAPFLPIKTWVHWVLYNIPVTVTQLPQNTTSQDLPPGTLQGKNGWKETGYKGPCPAIGRHRYFFKLYALDTVLSNLNQPDKSALEKAMKGHIVGRAELIGTYKH